jgi:ribonucleoside-diphosphate reductase alpha chain
VPKKEVPQKIRKRDGRIVRFDQDKITQAILKAARAVGEFDEKEAKRLADVVVNLLVKTTSTRIPEVEQVQDVVESVLVAADHYPTAKAYILYRQERAKEREARQLLGVEDDLKLPLNVLKVVERRYLRHDDEGNPIETPLGMLKRVAKAVAGVEKSAREKRKWEEKFLAVMTGFEFVPGGCYFRGAGTQSGQVANCFVLPVEDSIERIFEAVKWTALIHQTGGGTGFNFSHLRPKGDEVKSGGLASGPVNFIRAFDMATDIVMRGGLHRGANMGILNADHPDIFDFVAAKESGGIQNFNISVGASDEFMKAVKKNREWHLVNPRNGEMIQTISARSLFDQITAMAWRTGDPGMIYLDHINAANPVPGLGQIEATNVCGEQPLHPFDVCNLGSIDLARFVRRDEIGSGSLEVRHPKKSIHWRRLEEVVRLAVRFLDNGIDVGRYPIKELGAMAKANRRVGLGVMGWADLLYQLMIPYDSEESVRLAEEVMGFVNEAAVDESRRLAEEKGVFPNWEISIYKDKKVKRRHAAVTTIAPTGTISLLAETSSGIEPNFALAYVKNIVEESGLFYVNKHLQRVLDERGLYSFELVRDVSRTGSIQHRDDLPERIRRVFVTAHDISWEWHVKMQAAFQKHTENGVSKTINFPQAASVEEVKKAYLLAWELGCKGITTYRDKSRPEQILKVGEEKGGADSRDKQEERIQSKIRVTPLKKDKKGIAGGPGQLGEDICPECGGLLAFESGCATCYACGYSRCDA